MAILTQRNATIFFGAQAFWSVIVAGSVFPHAHWVDSVSVLFSAATAFLAVMGFNRTPSGNRLSPEVITQVDRQAVVARAGDVVVEAAAAAVIADAQSVRVEAEKK